MNRITPGLPVTDMKTYGIRAPLASHWRKASCVEVECPSLTGWLNVIDEQNSPAVTRAEFEAWAEAVRRGAPELINRDQARAGYIRYAAGRSFIEAADSSGATVFDFAPGQECFEDHRIRIDREELFIVRGGDWRGNPRRERMTHDRPEYWVEDFAEHQDRLATRLSRG